MSFTYDPTPVYTATGVAVTVLSGSGTRIYTNRFGNTFTTPLTVVPGAAGQVTNLLYLSGSGPVDGSGITWNVSTPLQMPGNGPAQLVTSITIYNQSGVVVESGESRVDGLGSAFLSNVPGFQNITVGASNINALAAGYSTCTAPITFTNGLRAPTQPSVSNGAVRIAYTYFITDGATYSVSGNLTITTSSAFANLKDVLGNPYQQVVNVAGTRLYTYLPTGAIVRSTVSGLSLAVNPLADQRFYPYSLLASAPGVYTVNTAPFFDFDGIEFAISPSAPANGASPTAGILYPAINLFFSTPEPTAVLTESNTNTLPSADYQTQTYSFLA